MDDPQQGSNSNDFTLKKIEQADGEFFKPVDLQKRKTIKRKGSM